MVKSIVLLLLATCLGMCLGYLLTASYYNPFLNSSRLYAEKRIGHWANYLKNQGSAGRSCGYVNYGDINNIFDSAGQKRLDKDPHEIVLLPVECIKDMKLVEMKYHASLNVVSGIYRCEKNDMIQEIQLAVYLEPKSVPQEDDCKVGNFLKTWDIPVGQATMFHLP